MKVGSIIAGKFRIERVIGRGAMGVVVEATDLSLNRRVAVKLILPHWAEDAQLRGRFIREAHVMTRLQSEHVAQVLEVGELEDGMLFMAMELLEGQSLEDMVSSGGPFPVSDAVDLILEALDAITEAHSLGLVHRDLKPSNLFLAARRGKPPILKVLDFGIVKDLGSQAKLTSTGTLPGTPAYMSPEQVAVEEDLIDARADVWALGVTLYELLTGELPFQGQINVLLTRIRTEAPPRLRARRPDVGPELEAIVARCLAKHPQDRYANGGELAAALSDLRMRGLIRSERGGERQNVETAVSMNRGRIVRMTADTEADPSQSAIVEDKGRVVEAPRGRVFPVVLIILALILVVGLVLALQGRLSSWIRPSGGAAPPASRSPSASPESSPPQESPSDVAPPASSGRSTPAPTTSKIKAAAHHSRLVSARNTSERAFRSWLERHRVRLESCTQQQPCFPVTVGIELGKSDGAINATVTPLQGSDGCRASSSLVDCLTVLAREPGGPKLDVCPDPAQPCQGDIQIAFE